MLHHLNDIAPAFNNRAIISPVAAWFVAQAIKVVVSLIRDKRLDLSYLVAMGGMPSAHAALVCSLATVLAVTEGTNSPLFAVSAIFAAVVMYDAAGVRQAVSRQAKILNKMIDQAARGEHVSEARLKELIGHTRLEVLAGAVLGIAIGLWLP
jgi:uncharacterized protein